MSQPNLHRVPTDFEEVVAITEKSAGWIEVICGSMFSGKTEELIRRLRRAQIARQRVAIFKPVVDVRYSEDYIVSHNQQKNSLNPDPYCSGNSPKSRQCPSAWN